MATLASIIKTEKVKKLSEEDAKKLEDLKKTSINNSEELDHFLRILGDSITSKSIKRIDSVDDVSSIQSKICESLYRAFSKSINAYEHLLLDFKKSGYSLPDIEKVPHVSLVHEKDTTYTTYGYYRKVEKGERNQVMNVCSEWMEGLNDYKKFDYSNILHVMETLGFVIMPLEFLSDTALSVDKRWSADEVRKKIENFKTAIDKISDYPYQYYVLCPLKYLDLMKWAKEKDITKKVTFSSSLSQVSLNINMSMPLFRSLFGSIEILEKRVTDVENRLEQEVKNLKEQQKIVEGNISALQEQLSSVKTEMVQRVDAAVREANESLDKRVKSLEAWRIACETDPLVFAKRGDSCYLGFAWGPEFPESILKQFGLK